MSEGYTDPVWSTCFQCGEPVEMRQSNGKLIRYDHLQQGEHSCAREPKPAKQRPLLRPLPERRLRKLILPKIRRPEP